MKRNNEWPTKCCLFKSKENGLNISTPFHRDGSLFNHKNNKKPFRTACTTINFNPCFLHAFTVTSHNIMRSFQTNYISYHCARKQTLPVKVLILIYNKFYSIYMKN